MKKVKELRGEFSAVLKKAYIQKESVDSVKDKKFTDPTGYEFLESWTWSWFEKQLKAQEKEVLERVEKLMLENILYIGDEIPSAIMEDKRSKFILLGFPGKFLSSLKGKRRAIK